jgi:hypothetical protein
MIDPGEIVVLPAEAWNAALIAECEKLTVLVKEWMHQGAPGRPAIMTAREIEAMLLTRCTL